MSQSKPFYKNWIFWCLLFYFLFIIIYTIYFMRFEGKNRPLSSNELGDFLAGTFAPLAFFFLYLGYKQQAEQLKQNTLALNQQAKSLDQQAKSLDIQIQELKVANKAYVQQVSEMSKSVKAQQEMFQLAEKQYIESRDEKIKSSTPQIQLIGSKYECINEYFQSNNLTHQFNVTLKAENLPIKNLHLTVSSWSVIKTGDQLNYSSILELNSLDPIKSEILLFYKATKDEPFNNDHIYINYYDERGNKYYKAYEITMNEDSYIIFKEKILAT